MPRQMVLLDVPADDAAPIDEDWRLDEHTREVGLRGIAEARRILADAARRAAA